MKKVISLGRAIDMAYPSNRAIVIITALAFPLAWVVYRDFSSALSVALGLFLAWAVTLELQPESSVPAFLALPLILAGAVIWGKPGNLLLMLWLILLMRMINGCTGIPLTKNDFILVGALSIWLSWSLQWAFLLVFPGASFFYIYRIYRYSSPNQEKNVSNRQEGGQEVLKNENGQANAGQSFALGASGMLFLAMAAILLFRWAPLLPPGSPALPGAGKEMLILGFIAALSAWIFLMMPPTQGVDDLNGAPLNQEYLQASRFLYLTLAVLATLSIPGPALHSYLWAPPLAVTLHHLYTLIRKKEER